MNKKIKKTLVYLAPHGLVAKRRKAQKERELEQKRIEQEQKRLEQERKREQKRLEQERKQEQKRLEQERKRLEQERKRKERERKEQERERKEQERKHKEQERKARIQEEKKNKFLYGKKTRKWSIYYSEYHQKEELEETWVLYESHDGIGMLCNPYAIFRAFQKMPEFDKYIHIWVIDNDEERQILQEEYSNYTNVFFIRYCNKAYAYFLAKAKFLINNTSFPFVFSKREGQIYLNTWHSITVKTLGYDTPDGNRIVKNMIRNFLMSDYIISPNAFMTKIFEESFRLANVFEGKYIQQGYPRNDLTIHAQREHILKKLEQHGTRIDPDKKVILYAPTWTGNAANQPIIDMSKYTDLYEHLSSHIDTQKYQILIKPHHVVYRRLSKEEKDSGYYVSYAIDTNELLSIVDILITDYSSIYFDFLVTDRPILFYIPDYRQYEQIRGIYFKLEELPGPCAKSLESLEECVNQIEKYEKDYQAIRKRTREWACKFDDGHVSEKIIDVVFCNKEHDQVLSPQRDGRKKILMFGGNFQTNGVTSAMLSLLKVIDYQKYDVSLFVLSLKSNVQDENFDKLPSQIRVLMRCGSPMFTEEQNEIYQKTLHNGFAIAPQEIPMQEYLMRREFMRCFGDSKFDYVIDFAGYVTYFSCLVLKQCKEAVKLIWQHSDMMRDFKNVEKKALNKSSTTIDSILSVYPYYQKIVSASEPICIVNRENLATKETRDKFTYASNILDQDRIKTLEQSVPKCRIGGRLYIRIINEISKNDVQNVTLIPLDNGEKPSIKFVTMGRCMPEKNHHTLIRALKRLIEEGEDCMLYIVGDGHMRSELENLAEKLGIGNRVIITGFMSNPFVIMKECDCFVFPSIYEAQGLAVLEARMVGLPIVVSNYPAVTSVLLEDKQYIMNGTDTEAVYEGMRAYLDGKVPGDYQFDAQQYNQKAYQEFLDLL